MKNLGHGVTGVLGFLAGWLLRPLAGTPNHEEVGITLFMENGHLTKKMYSMKHAAKTNDKITWAIRNETGSPVVVCLVRFTVTGTPVGITQEKMPFKKSDDLCTRKIANGKTGEIKAEVGSNDMLLKEKPEAKDRDEFDKYHQDFTYWIRVVGDGWEDTIDPEIRIREC